MNIRHEIGRITAFLSLLVFLSIVAQAAEAPSGIAPGKRSLVIPVTLAPQRDKRGDSLKCVVTTGPEIPVSALAFSSDGKILVVGGYQEVLVWDLANAKLLKRIGAGQINNFVRALAFLKDDRLLAVGDGTPHGPGAVRIFDMETGQQTFSFEEPNDVVYALALSPDDKLLAAGGADKQVYIWSLEDKKLVSVIKEHGDWVLSASFSPDGKFLATGSADKTAQVWEVGTWKSVVKMQQNGPVHDSVFSSDGRQLAVAVGGPNGRAVRIQRKDNVRQTSVIYTDAGMPLDVIWTAKPNRVYVSCSDKTVKVFDAAKRRLVTTLSGHGDWVYAIALSPDGAKLASGSADGTIKLWNVADGRLLATLLQLSPRTDDWLIITAHGYVATSSSSALRWKTTSLTTPPDELTKLLQNPDSVREALAGKKMTPPAIQ